MAGFDKTFFEYSICNKTVGQCQICYSASNLKDICQNIQWKSILRLKHLAGSDDTFFECSICDKTVGLCQISVSASSLKDLCQNIKWKSRL